MLFNAFGWFRFITIVEGISYVLLLGVGLPIKFLLDNEEITKILGSLHGFLFIVFGLLLLWMGKRKGWTLIQMALIFIGSLIPFGNFFIDRKILKPNA